MVAAQAANPPPECTWARSGGVFPELPTDKESQNLEQALAAFGRTLDKIIEKMEAIEEDWRQNSIFISSSESESEETLCTPRSGKRIASRPDLMVRQYTRIIDQEHTTYSKVCARHNSRIMGVDENETDAVKLFREHSQRFLNGLHQQKVNHLEMFDEMMAKHFPHVDKDNEDKRQQWRKQVSDITQRMTIRSLSTPVLMIDASGQGSREAPISPTGTIVMTPESPRPSWTPRETPDRPSVSPRADDLAQSPPARASEAPHNVRRGHSGTFNMEGNMPSWGSLVSLPPSPRDRKSVV